MGWDEFRDWCKDNHINLEIKTEWELYWKCWQTARASLEEEIRTA